MSETNKPAYHEHPCFNPEAKGRFGRVHLPVAPRCNVKCNFCDRRYDCVNESRPGVTSTVLTAEQAAVYVDRVVAREPRITVAGIAGPGDPFANGRETMATLRAVRRSQPEMMLCVSSNGMGIGPYIDELAEIGVSHVTITVCAVDPEIGRKIYSWVKDGKVVYRGRQGAELLLSRQLDGVRRLKKHGLIVKINCIVIPGVNEDHVEAVAETMRDLGADLFNCMAMFPNVNTPFGHLPQIDKKRLAGIQRLAERFLPQMRHCTRCRADAVGLLGEDQTASFRSCLSECSTLPPQAGAERPYVAAATQEGILVNRHLGETSTFEIWERHGDGFRRVEERPAPSAGGGIKRWHRLARILGDCRAVLVSGIGPTPHEILSKSGVAPVEIGGFIEDGLRSVYGNTASSHLKARRSACGTGCSGSGEGCG